MRLTSLIATLALCTMPFTSALAGIERNIAYNSRGIFRPLQEAANALSPDLCVKNVSFNGFLKLEIAGTATPPKAADIQVRHAIFDFDLNDRVSINAETTEGIKIESVRELSDGQRIINGKPSPAKLQRLNIRMTAVPAAIYLDHRQLKTVLIDGLLTYDVPNLRHGETSPSSGESNFYFTDKAGQIVGVYGLTGYYTHRNIGFFTGSVNSVWRKAAEIFCSMKAKTVARDRRKLLHPTLSQKMPN